MTKEIPGNLFSGRRLYLDGGCGTYLQKRGLAGGELPERWNLTHPEEVVAMHQAYLDAGSNIITSNTFGANELKLGDEVEEIISAAIENAQKARSLAGRPDALIALDIGPTGRLLEPLGDLPFEDAVSVFKRSVKAGTEAGADLILIETMSDAYEIKAAVLAAKENSPLPVFVTMVFDESGHTLTGGTPESMTALLEGLGVDAFGVNCSLGPDQLMPVIGRFLKASSHPVITSPNAGLPRVVDGTAVYDIDPAAFACSMEKIASMGAHLMGGCCGTTPGHIAEMIRVTSALPFEAPVKKADTVVSSGSQEVRIGDDPAAIGRMPLYSEDAAIKEAIEEEDTDELVSACLDQEDDQDAEILDVNVSMPGTDETELLTDVIRELQMVTSLPLRIHASSKEALECALRTYNGKAMVAADTSEDSMNTVFPLIRKYGGVASVPIPSDTDIPADQLKENILQTADQYGISRRDICFSES